MEKNLRVSKKTHKKTIKYFKGYRTKNYNGEIWESPPRKLIIYTPIKLTKRELNAIKKHLPKTL